MASDDEPPVTPQSVINALASAIDERMLANVEALDLRLRHNAILDLICIVEEFGIDDVQRWLANITAARGGQA